MKYYSSEESTAPAPHFLYLEIMFILFILSA